MSEAIETLNTESESSTDETLNAGESSAPMESGDGLVSTVEFETATPAEGTNETESKKGPVPYERLQEKVQQFNQLSEEFNSYKSDTEKQIAELRGMVSVSSESATKAKPKELNYNPVQNMSADDIRDALDDNPLGFMANLAAQIRHETLEEAFQEIRKTNTQKTYQERLSEFGEKNDGFLDMLNSGQLETYARNNPGFDVFSAYNELTADQRAQSEKEKIETAVKEALEKQKTEFEKNQKAKRALRTVTPSTAPTTTTNDSELSKLSDTHGGLVSGLSARLAARRRAKAG